MQFFILLHQNPFICFKLLTQLLFDFQFILKICYLFLKIIDSLLKFFLQLSELIFFLMQFTF